MSADPARHLRPVEDKPPIILVNSATGENVGTLAEVEAAHEAEYNALQHKYRAALADITRLKRDSEAEARRHQLWAEAEALHGWWAIATGHPGRKFGADEFYQVFPRLKEKAVGPIGVLKAIAGAAYDPGTKRLKNGRVERYDSFELVTRSRDKIDSFSQRVPGGPESEAWKRWLIERIESALKD